MQSIFVTLALLVPCRLQVCMDQKDAQPLRDDSLRACRASLSRDGKSLVVVGGSQNGGDWKIFDLASGKCKVDGSAGNLRCWGGWGACISDDNALAAVAGNGDYAFVVEADSGKLVWKIMGKNHLAGVDEVLFSPDRKYLITGGSNVIIRVWDLQNKTAHAAFRFTSVNAGMNVWLNPSYFEPAKNLFDVKGRYDQPPGGLAITPDGKALAIGGNLDGEVPIIDLASGKVLRTVKLKQECGSCLQFTSDGKWLVVGGGPRNGAVEVWDLAKD